MKYLSKPFATLASLNFLFFFFLAAVSYVNSSFLGLFLSPSQVSISFAVQAMFAIIALSAMPLVVATTGTRLLILILTPITAVAAVFLGISESATSAIIFFIIQGVSIYCLMYVLDLYLESITKNENTTGNVRGIFLTSGNLAVFLSPFAIAILVIEEIYTPLYIFAALVLIPALAVALTALKRLKSVTPRHHPFVETLSKLWSSRTSLRRILGAYLLLWIFYSWVVIYTPLVLIGSGGHSWQTVGLITAFALLPFLFLEIPLGIIADRWLGEREIMAGGFLVIGVSTALLSVIPLSMLVAWAIAFFFTRVGASMIEISTETYFFKKVDENDTALVSLFRMTRSLGFLVGPVIALAVFPFTGLHYLFGAFGLILLAGIPLSFGIRDTK